MVNLFLTEAMAKILEWDSPGTVWRLLPGQKSGESTGQGLKNQGQMI